MKPQLKLERFYVYFLTETKRLSFRLIKAYTRKQAEKRFVEHRGKDVSILRIDILKWIRNK